jgi:hypothetical protein
MKVLYFRDEWSRPYFAEIPYTMEFPARSRTWIHPEYSCETDGGILNLVEYIVTVSA